MKPPVQAAYKKFMEGLVHRNPGEREFHQAVQEFSESLFPFYLEHSKYPEAYILERMTEPDRIITFRVTWKDDRGNIRANRGYRVQFNNAIGPYKGGLRFHPTVNQSVLKFLGFEQVFKNSLTGLPMGGAKGGANFNPKGKSDDEVMRFCQSFITELSRHIGKDIDIPSGDIGVGPREIGYMFGFYHRLHAEFSPGVITGKPLAFGGSPIRTEATGYGAVYFAKDMLAKQDEGLKGRACLVSGAGNVAQYTVEKLLNEGAKVITLSDSTGFVLDSNGLDEEKLAFVKELKNQRRGNLSEYAKKFKSEYHSGKKPWGVQAELAFPCATQNEITLADARAMIDNGIRLVCEGANMPTALEAVHLFLEKKVLFGPGKAANAGGVAVSGLEQTQNAMRLQWSREEVCGRLEEIMKKIHQKCVNYGTEGDYINYVKGANIAGFIKVADTMLSYGVV